MSEKEFSELIWKALKEEACVHPKTACLIVTLNQHDVENAVKNTPKLRDICKNDVDGV